MAPVGGPIAVFETDAEGDAPAPASGNGAAKPTEAKTPEGDGLTATPARSEPAQAPPAQAAEPAQPKPRIKAPAGAVWSEDAVQAALQGGGAAVPIAAMPAAAGPRPQAKAAAPQPASQAVARPEAREATVREWSQAQASPAGRARAQKLGIDLGQGRRSEARRVGGGWR